MRHRSILQLPGALVLIAAGILVLADTAAFAQDPAAPTEPQPTPAAQETASAEPDAPEQAVAPRVFQPAWEIVVDGKAETNGTLELVFEPHGGKAKLLKVNVVAKMGKDEIAKDLAQEITFAAGSEYKVKRSGNKVKVKVTNKKMKPLHIGIETQAVNGVSVRVGKK